MLAGLLMKRMRWLIGAAIAIVAVATVLLWPGDNALETVYYSVPRPDTLESRPARVLSADPFVVEWVDVPGRGVVISSQYVSETLRAELVQLDFDEYVILRSGLVQLPCDCGPDEVPPIQPVVFEVEVTSQAAVAELSDANTSGGLLRFQLDGGMLSVHRDGEVVWIPSDGSGDRFLWQLTSAELGELIAPTVVELFAERGRPVRPPAGAFYLRDGYHHVYYSDFRGDQPPDWFQPTLDEMELLAERVEASGERLARDSG